LNALFIEEFYKLIFEYIDFKTDIDIFFNRFSSYTSYLPKEVIIQEMDYIKSNAFLSESTIKYDDLFKKRNGQYLKYKSIPKWHHYAWDIIK